MTTVLLVDDDNTVLLTLGVRLNRMGYKVCTAMDAVNAVSAVREHHPAVVVLDISLPAGNGFVVAERLRGLIGVAATPVIFISSSDDPSVRERALKLGAAFLKKPIGAAALADAIEAALSPGEDWGPPQAV